MREGEKRRKKEDGRKRETERGESGWGRDRERESGEYEMFIGRQSEKK